jgi:hypothetical protein
LDSILMRPRCRPHPPAASNPSRPC